MQIVIVSIQKTREYAVERWAASIYSEDILSKLKKLNVDVYNDFNLKEIDKTKISAAYKQI